MLITVSQSFVVRDSLAPFWVPVFVKAVASIRVPIQAGPRQRGHLLISLSVLQGQSVALAKVEVAPGKQRMAQGFRCPPPPLSALSSLGVTADFCFSLILSIVPLKEMPRVWGVTPNPTEAGCDILTIPLSYVPGAGE